MLYTKNRLFAKNGHECEITYTVDELPMFIPSSNLSIRIYRKLVRMRMASEVNRRGNYYLRSQGAVAQEHYRHLKHLYMIHPFSDIRTIWEIFMAFVYLYSFISIPLDILSYHLGAMDGFRAGITWKVTRTIGDTVCLLDVGLNFVTGYYDEKNKAVIMEPLKVIMKYVKTYFIFDLISSMPTHLELISNVRSTDLITAVLHYVSAFKILRFITFRTYCEHFAETFDIQFVTYRVCIALQTFILYYHCTCCLLLYVFSLLFFVDKDMIYMFRENLKQVVTSSYTHALYITTLLICTAGYSPVLEISILKLMVIFIWVISKILYIYLLAKVIEVVTAWTSSTHKYDELVRQLKEYMRHKECPEYMQKRLLCYYEFRFRKSYFRESEILNTISGQLRQELVMHSCRKLVENVGFFRNLPLTLLVRIVSCLTLEIYLVNDVIVRANTPGDSMYFISSGTVAVYTKSGKEICHLEDGSHFGEIALVMNEDIRISSVVAVEICELYMLDRKDFVRVIYPYPDLLNTVTHIAADRLERTNIMDEQHRREINTKRIYQTS